MNALNNSPGAWVERYLAGRLSAVESEQFERYWAQHPELTREIEVCARLRSGLAELRSRGELPGLLRRPWWHSRLNVLAVAAGIAALAVGVVTLGSLRDSAGGPALAAGLIAAEIAQLPHKPGASALIETVTVLRLRNSIPTDALVDLPRGATALHLRVMPDVGSDAQRYALALAPRSADGSVAAGASLRDLVADGDGYVHAFVDAAALRSGIYELTLQPHGRGPEAVSRFAIEVRAPARR